MDSISEEGMEAARAFAQWHLGEPGWAGQIIAAYNNPAATWEQLADEGMRGAARKAALLAEVDS